MFRRVQPEDYYSSRDRNMRSKGGPSARDEGQKGKRKPMWRRTGRIFRSMDEQLEQVGERH